MKQILKTFTGLAVVITSLFGIFDAGYITWNDVRGIVPPCRPPFACNEVLQSPWAHIGPIPLSAIGMLYYATVFLLGILHFGEVPLVKFGKKVKFRPSELLFMLTSAGILFSAYLVAIMAFTIRAWCLYCLISASFSFILFLLSFTIHLRKRSHLNLFVSSLRRRMFGLFYQILAKPIFFSLDAEFVHVSMTRVGNLLGQFAPTRMLTGWLFKYSDTRLRKTVDGILFQNPIGLSAGFDYNGDLTQIVPQVGFGFTTVGTITNEAYGGNKRPLLGRFPRSKALLVNKGFKNLGAEAIIAKLTGKKFAIPVAISIGSTNKQHASLAAQIGDIVECFAKFEKSKVNSSFYELNISCPNTTGGQPFTTPECLKKLISALEKLEIKKPIYIKMPIDLGDKQTLSLLQAAKPYKIISGVIFGNLTKDKTNPDVHPLDLKLWREMRGNLSGKPTLARSNHWIELTKKTFKSRFTIIGTGGIFTPEDAKLKLKLGADLVQLITGMIFEGPQLIGEINEELAQIK